MRARVSGEGCGRGGVLAVDGLLALVRGVGVDVGVAAVLGRGAREVDHRHASPRRDAHLVSK